MRYLLSNTLFSGFEELSKELGADPDELLSQFGLPRNIETQTDGYVPLSQASMLFEYCAKSFDCPDFGLRLSQRQGLSILGPVAVLARNATTVEAAARSIGDYLHLLTPAIAVEFELVPSLQCIRAKFTLAETGLLQSRQLFELYVGNGQLIIQMLIGTEVFAQKMYFPHARLAPKSVYQRLFRCDVAFNQELCAVDLPFSIMNQTLKGADQETAQIASNYLAEHYGLHAGTLADQVQHLVSRLLPTGQCRLTVIAEQLTLHPRTLQRRLNELGVVFEELVDAHRRTLAKRYLAQSELRLTQVAGLLGYADQSALNRSCQRWFGESPRSVRIKANTDH